MEKGRIGIYCCPRKEIRKYFRRFIVEFARFTSTGSARFTENGKINSEFTQERTGRRNFANLEDQKDHSTFSNGKRA